jgi:hypothetical protein
MLAAPLLHQITNVQFYVLDNSGNYQIASSPLPKNQPIFVAGCISPNGSVVRATLQIGAGASGPDLAPCPPPNPPGKDFVIPIGPIPNMTGNPIPIRVRTRITSPPGDPAASSISDNVSA